jgi:hypothetical protein
MPFEDLEIRIARDGRVYLHVDGITEERIQSIRRFLEEEIGPVHSVEVVRKPDWDRPVAQAAEDAARQDELELEQND